MEQMPVSGCGKVASIVSQVYREYICREEHGEYSTHHDHQWLQVLIGVWRYDAGVFQWGICECVPDSGSRLLCCFQLVDRQKERRQRCVDLLALVVATNQVEGVLKNAAGILDV